MKLFSLATNFEDDLIDKIKNKNVYEVYGRLVDDPICGGRQSNAVNQLTKQKFETHVKKARESGINFNYLLNGACLGNNESSSDWQEEIINFLKYLDSIGVNSLTITNPLLLELVKRNFPQFTCRISTFACINNLQKAKYWQNIGADIICVDFTTINRDFNMLKLMVKELKCKIELLCTNSCLKDCIYIQTHTNCNAHASTATDKTKSNSIDWCLLNCQKIFIENPAEYIKSPWIRPEDLQIYEQIGIEHFKLTERDSPTNELVKRLDAYNSGIYNGNLLDLIQGHGWIKNDTILKKTITQLNHFDNIYDVVNEIKKIRGLATERQYIQHIYIDNKKLDGFLSFFTDGKCHGDCERCGYCNSIANEAIKENYEVKSYLLFLYKKFKKLLIKEKK